MAFRRITGRTAIHFETESKIMSVAMLDQTRLQPNGANRIPGVARPAKCRSVPVQHPRSSSTSEARGLEQNSSPVSGTERQDDSERQTRADERQLLKAIVASKVFTEFERAFTEATGMPLVLVPVESFQLSFPDRGKQGPFCALMAGENRTCGACLQAQAQVAGAALEGPHTTTCYAGLCETVVPLRLGNRLIGLLRTGQVLRAKPSEPQFQRAFRLLASWGLNVDENVLRRAFFGTRVVSPAQHAGAVKLLNIFAEHLAIVSNQILIQQDNDESPIVTRAKEFIRLHHGDDLNLSQVAQSANTSPFYFCKLFRQATGLTFTNFLCRVRLESAKALLQNPQKRISEAAFEAGFQSVTNFNRVFKKMLGESPSAYRQKVQTGTHRPRSRRRALQLGTV